MSPQVSQFRLQEEPVPAKVVGLRFKTEFFSIRAPIRTPAPVVIESIFLVLVALRLAIHGVDAEPGIVFLEVPPCPGPRAWVIRDVHPEELLAQGLPGFGSVVLSEVRPVAEASVEEVAAGEQVIPVIVTVERAAVSGSRSSWHGISP